MWNLDIYIHVCMYTYIYIFLSKQVLINIILKVLHLYNSYDLQSAYTHTHSHMLFLVPL